MYEEFRLCGRRTSFGVWRPTLDGFEVLDRLCDGDDGLLSGSN